MIKKKIRTIIITHNISRLKSEIYTKRFTGPGELFRRNAKYRICMNLLSIRP